MSLNTNVGFNVKIAVLRGRRMRMLNGVFLPSVCLALCHLYGRDIIKIYKLGEYATVAPFQWNCLVMRLLSVVEENFHKGRRDTLVTEGDDNCRMGGMASSAEC